MNHRSSSGRLRVEALALPDEIAQALKANRFRTVQEIRAFGPLNVAFVCKLGDQGAALIEAALGVPPKYVELLSQKAPFKTATSFEQKVQFSCSDELLRTPVSQLRLSSRAVAILRRLGLETISHILDYGVGNLAGLASVGELTSANIENAILDLVDGESLNQEVSFRRLLNSLLPPAGEKRDIMKARFGYDTGTVMRAPEIARVLGTSEYRVAKIILREMPNMTLGQAGIALFLIRQRFEAVLYANGHIAALEDILQHRLLRSCSRSHGVFIANVLCTLFPESYRIIDARYLTTLTPSEVATRTREVVSAYRAFLETMSTSRRGLTGEFAPSPRYVLHCLHMAHDGKGSRIDGQLFTRKGPKGQRDRIDRRGYTASPEKPQGVRTLPFEQRPDVSAGSGATDERPRVRADKKDLSFLTNV